MRKKGLLITCLAVVLALLLVVACAEPTPEPTPTPTPTPIPTPTPTPTPTPAEPIMVKLGYDTPPPTGLGVPAEFFAKEVTERTEGRVTVETYPAGALVTAESSLQSLRAGVADAYVISISAMQDAFPVNQYASLPGLDFFPHTEELLEMETNTMRALIDKYPAAAEEFEDFKMLYSNTYTSAVLMGKGEPIRTPSGIKGKKAGCDGLRQDLMEHLGAAPVFTIPPFMYEQLQTGVTDVVFVAWGAALDWQLQELVDYTYDMTFGGGQLPVVMSMDVWNKISPGDQQIVTEVAAEAEQVNRDFITGQIPEAKQLWKDTGIPILTPTADELALWEEVFATIWDEYLELNRSAGVTDIEAIFNEWKDAIEKVQAGMFFSE